MKALRLLRNIAVLFILLVILPVGLSRQERKRGCSVYEPGSQLFQQFER